MGRLGRLPVSVEESVEIKLEGNKIIVKGPKGELTLDVPQVLDVKIENREVVISRKNDSKIAKATQGSIRAHVANMIHGVKTGWSKQLEINGPGYRAEAKGSDLSVIAGYSHPVVINGPKGIEFKVEKNLITVEGFNKEDVGQTAALVRGIRPPNVYTGSGIKYADEVIRRKAGKQAAKAGE